MTEVSARSLTDVIVIAEKIAFVSFEQWKLAYVAMKATVVHVVGRWMRGRLRSM